jgi:hypothetical protein
VYRHVYLTARQTAEDAYIFGYPLVLMDVTREVGSADHGLNRFRHALSPLDPTFTRVITSNADMLISAAWLDLSCEPLILSVPCAANRYYILQMLDAWTNVFASVGTRTTGNGAQQFVIVGPRWDDPLPRSLRKLLSPTNMVWVIGRFRVDGPTECTAINALQRQIQLCPLSNWRASRHASFEGRSIDRQTLPVDQVARMDPFMFFTRLARLMRNNPPAGSDADAMRRFAVIGLVPGAPFSRLNINAVAEVAISTAASTALARIAMNGHVTGTTVNGWSMAFDLGRYGTDYTRRALVARYALGANLVEDALYPWTATDRDGGPLTGLRRYILRFPMGGLPPVNALWSVTLYGPRQLFVENPLRRYTISDRDPLRFNPDGSLTIYIQGESPGPSNESNWLPAPRSTFTLILRMYWPKAEVLARRWQPPPVERVGT